MNIKGETTKGKTRGLLQKKKGRQLQKEIEKKKKKKKGGTTGEIKRTE